MLTLTKIRQIKYVAIKFLNFIATSYICLIFININISYGFINLLNEQFWRSIHYYSYWWLHKVSRTMKNAAQLLNLETAGCSDTIMLPNTQL